jgi:shikimate dehydrogenase
MEVKVVEYALSGATRVHVIVGDPIAQVKSPAGMTAVFHSRGHNAVCVPAHVSADDLPAWFAGIATQKNIDSVIVTVPHKFSFYALCATSTARAAFVSAVNVMRRNADGTWHGDMCDGQSFVSAIKHNGGKIQGARALLVGAGGAGSAIAHSLMLEGATQLAVHDADAARRDTLIERLRALGTCEVVAGSDDPTGFTLVANATPMGMRPNDPLPVQVNRLSADTFVGCVVTLPVVPAFIAAAKARGCNTSNGSQMWAQVGPILADFILEGERAST